MNEYRMARRVLVAEVSGGRVRGVKVVLGVEGRQRRLRVNAVNIGRNGELWCICR